MKIFALIRNLMVQSCDLSDTPPPTIRTFDFTTQCLIERPKFVQGVFQGLWVLYLFTRAKCQICVFHTEVCSYAFTCSGQRSKICIGRCNTKPIVPATITLDCDKTDSSVPLTMLMESIWNFIKLPFACFRIPFTEGQRDTIIFQRPPRFSWVSDRLKLVTLFDFRSATEFLEKSIVCLINPFQFLLDCLRRQRLLMRVCRLFQYLHMAIHSIIVRIRQPVCIPLTLPFMKILVDLPHVVKQVANTNRIRLFPKWVFIVFHGLSSTKSLTPVKWVGRHTIKGLCLTCLPT